jgi:hypothetical protein
VFINHTDASALQRTDAYPHRVVQHDADVGGAEHEPAGAATHVNSFEAEAEADAVQFAAADDSACRPALGRRAGHRR